MVYVEVDELEQKKAWCDCRLYFNQRDLTLEPIKCVMYIIVSLGYEQSIIEVKYVALSLGPWVDDH